MAKTKDKAPAATESDQLEELEDDEVTEDKPSKGGSQQSVTFGVSDLAKHLSGVTGKEVKPRDLRTQIRRMAREENARVNREITAGNRTRYDWPDGLKDPEVKAIIAAVTGGEMEEGKKAALQALKDRKASKKGDKGSKGKGKGKNKAADDEVLEDDDE